MMLMCRATLEAPASSESNPVVVSIFHCFIRETMSVSVPSESFP